MQIIAWKMEVPNRYLKELTSCPVIVWDYTYLGTYVGLFTQAQVGMISQLPIKIISAKCNIFLIWLDKAIGVHFKEPILSSIWLAFEVNDDATKSIILLSRCHHFLSKIN